MHRTLRLALVVLLLSACSFAAISRTGSCSAATTSCTLSATATGDLIIVIAARASATPPSLPASNTTVTTRAQGTNSYRVYCRVASSSGDTGTGTATNATRISAVSYSGTSVHATADCPQTGLGLPPGGTALNSAASSTTLNYAALTMNSTDTTSWVVGASYNTASAGCTPSGMSSVTSNGSGPGIIINDTNATVNSWASTNCTVTSGTWLSWTGEVVAAASGSGTPTMVQYVVDPSTLVSLGHDGSSGPTSYTLRLPNGAQAGNTVVVGFSVLTSTSMATGTTISDTQSNNWIQAETCNDATNQWWNMVFYAQKVAAGTREITITPPAGLKKFNMGIVGEFNNVAPHAAYDGVNCHAAASSSATSGSVTTTANGDLVFAFFTGDNDPTFTNFTSGTGMTVFANGAFNLQAAEYQVQSSLGAINPGITIVGGTNNNYVGETFALKSGSSGSPRPAGMQIVGMTRIIMQGGDLSFPGSGQHIHVPVVGNMGYLQVNTGSASDITAITDATNGSWTQTGPFVVANVTHAGTHAYYHCNIAPQSDLDITLTTLSPNPWADSGNIVIYDTAGAATSCFDQTVTNTGQQTTAGSNNTTLASITPAAAGIVYVVGGEDFNLSTGFATTFTFDACSWGNDGYASGDPTNYSDNNNIWGHYNNPGTTTLTATGTWFDATQAPQWWAVRLDAFKAPAGGTTIDSSNGAIIF